MVIFIDESGTHKQSGHAANAIVYIKITNLEEVEQGLKEILKDLELDFFHWADHGWKVRNRFLKKIIRLNFTFKIGIFQNPIKTHEMTETVFGELITEKAIKNVFIDGKQPKWYERRLKKVLRDKGISVGKLRTIRNESSHPGIQLADSLAGLFRYHFENPRAEDAQKWVGRFKKEKKLLSEKLFE